MIGKTNASSNVELPALENGLAIIINGNKTSYASGAAIGNYVFVKNSTISGRPDGLYKAALPIPANTAINSNYLTEFSENLRKQDIR